MTAANWTALAQALVGLVTRVWDAVVSRFRTRKRKRESYERALADWRDALASGDASKVLDAKRKVDKLREAGWHRFSLPILLLVCVSGCRTAKLEIVPAAEHIRVIEPGDIVPPYPNGENNWRLATPTGLEWMLPADSPFLNEEVIE